MIPKLIEAIVRSLPAGECLDSYILLHRPAPDGIGSLPGDELLDQLKRERSLYWAELYAATTPLP